MLPQCQKQKNAFRDAGSSRNQFVCPTCGKVPNRVLTEVGRPHQFSLKVLSRHKQECCWKLGDNKQSYALYEELKHLRVEPEAGTPYIYKRLDTQVHLPVEERAWQIRVPVPSTKGVRKSLKVTEKADAISKAEEMVLEIKVQLKQGVGVLPTPVESVVEKFLDTKRDLVSDAWESKEDR